jgi:hypothetical protein
MVDVKVHIFMSRPLVHLKGGCDMIPHYGRCELKAKTVALTTAIGN